MPDVIDQTSPHFLGHSYDNFITWRPVTNDHEFQIAAAPVPWTSITILNTLFIAFTAGWIFLALRYSPPSDHALVYTVGLAVGLLTCTLFTAIALYRFRGGLRKGPFLLFNRASNLVSLPRHGRTFPAGAVRLQLLYLVGMQGQGAGGSELHLRATGPDGDETFLLITSIFFSRKARWTNGIFEPLLRAVETNTPLRVERIAMSSRTTLRT